NPLERIVWVKMLIAFKASEFKERFEIKQFKSDDANYLYLDIKPKLSREAQELTRMRLALHAPGAKVPATPYSPAELYLIKPNDDTELWKFSDLKINVKVDGKEIGSDFFQFEDPKGEGWTTKKVPGWPKP